MPQRLPLRRAVLLCAAAAAALLLCLAAAWLTPAGADLDRIRSYTVTVDPRADGSADITYDIDWEVIGGSADEPLSWVRIGLANGEADGFENLSPDTVSDVRYMDGDGGSFARVTFKKRYYPPDYAAASGQESRVRFAFRVHQSHLYTRDENGGAVYVFTPGWFSDLSIDQMTVRWYAGAGTTADTDLVQDGYYVWEFGALGHDERATVRVTVSPEAAAGFAESTVMPESAPAGTGTAQRVFKWLAAVVLLAAALFALAALLSLRPRWRGGFGAAVPDWVFYTNGVHTIHLAPGRAPPAGYTRTAPPPGFKAGGGRFRGGGAGKSDSNDHHSAGCACACACVSCACACACAGGGRAGCSVKNFYRIRLHGGANGGQQHEH